MKRSTFLTIQYPSLLFSEAKKGFTLIEVVLAVSLLAILLYSIFIAINPQKNIAESRNTLRKNDINEIANAIYQYSVDNKGTLPEGIDGNVRMIGTDTGSCMVSCAGLSSSEVSSISLLQGNYSNTYWNAGSGDLELNSTGKLLGSGYFISSIFDAGQSAAWTSLSWTPIAPYHKELPDNGVSEIAYSTSNANMTNNVLLLHLNETSGAIIDTSGKNNNGTGYNLTYNVTGKLKKAISFNGINSHVVINNSSTLQISDTLTMEAWVMTSANRSAKILQKGDWDGFSLYQDMWNGWAASIKLQDDSGTSIKWTDGIPVLNKWYHLAATYDGIMFKLFVNGQLVNSHALTGPIKVTTRRVSLGSDNGVQKFFMGAIDEAAIYARALSSVEILDHYSRGAERIKIQLRSCNDALCNGIDFVGPDGTSGSVYSNLDNSSLGLPQFAISNLSDNRYFQVKVLLETDSATFTPKLVDIVATHALSSGSNTVTTADSCVNLQEILVPEYLAEIPDDPQLGSQEKTYYVVSKVSDHRIKVNSCNSELGRDLAIYK